MTNLTTNLRAACWNLAIQNVFGANAQRYPLWLPLGTISAHFRSFAINIDPLCTTLRREYAELK